jgi:hypothetical protein
VIDFTVFPDDVFLASYPRSGNTWTRFLLGNLRNVTTTTFANLDRRIPNVYRVPEAELLRHRRPRVLKTHEPVDSGYRRAIYLVRYPGDIAPSFLRYLHMMRECPPEMGLEDFLPRFVAGDVPFGSWSDHVTGWLTRSREEVLLVRYEDMMRDTACEVRRMTDFLGLGVVGVCHPPRGGSQRAPPDATARGPNSRA